MSKIVFIHLFNDRSGSPKVLSQVIAACRENGLETEVLTSKHKDGFLTGVADKTINLFYKRSESKVLTLIYYLLSQLHLFWLCLNYRNKDIVIYVNTMMPFAAGVAGRFLGKRVIFHVHETSIKPRALKKMLRFFIEKTASKVIFVSKYLSKKEGFEKPDQLVIYNAVPTPKLEKVGPVEKANDVFKVLMVCSLKEYKGVKEFITLAKSLSDMEFTLVLNATRFEIDTIFDSWSIELPSNLKIYPRQSKLEQFYQKSSVVLNLSRPDGWVETFGLTIVEAMSYGKPVIVPPIGGPAEIVTDGDQGYLISCYDLDEVKEKLERLSCNQQLYVSMSNSALERSKKFSEKEFKRNVLNILQSANRV